MNISSEYLPTLIGTSSIILSNVVTWFLAKKKYNSEVDTTLISNMQDSLEFYMKLSDDNKTRLDETLKRNESLEKEVYQLRDQVFKLMNSMVEKQSKHTKKCKEDKNEVNSNKKVQRTKVHNRKSTN